MLHLSLSINLLMIQKTYRNVDKFSNFVSALEKFSPEKLHAHNGEYQPEHETDEEHVENTRYGVHQRVHYNLYKRRHKIIQLIFPFTKKIYYRLFMTCK